MPRAQQLRLHACDDLTCRIALTAGAILEHCRQISFFRASADEPLDVKDFDWLYNGMPSPNFTIQDQDDFVSTPTCAFPVAESYSTAMNQRERPASTATTDSGGDVASVGHILNDGKDDKEENDCKDDDDDDEL